MSNAARSTSSVPRRARLGAALLGIGFVTLLLGAWSAAQLRVGTARGPFFVDARGVAIAEDGAILVGVANREVHAYDADGKLVRGWRLGSANATSADEQAFASAASDRVDLPDGGGVELTAEGLVRVARGGRTLLVPLPPFPLSMLGTDPTLPILLIFAVSLGCLVAGIGFSLNRASATGG
jgi:hypothetical protein